MKLRQRALRLALALAAALCVITTATPPPVRAVDYTTYSGFAVSETPVLPEKESHPSLWFHPKDLPRLQQKRTFHEYAGKLYASIFSSPYLKSDFPAPPAKDDPKKSIQNYYGDMARIAKYSAFKWIIEGDAKARDRAVAALLRAYDGPIYELDPKESSSAVDEIYRCNWLQNFAAAYDWVQPDLTPEQDRIIRDKIAREAQLTYEKLFEWGPRPHNHLSKPAWGLGTAALTLSSHPMAKAWLERALKAANQNTRYFFSADGIYREGSHYLLYSWTNFMPFLYHYNSVSGVNLFPAYQPVFDWMLYVRNGRGWLPNTEDGWLKPAPLHTVAQMYMETPTPLNKEAKLGNLYVWSYFNTDIAPWGGVSYTGASTDDTLDLDEYISYCPLVKPMAPAANAPATLFMDKGGQTVFRNNWSYKDPSHRYLLFHGVAEADNHFHYDHLSFQIQAEDQMMASDAGYTRSGYSDVQRTDWYLTAKAHNVVAMGGQAPVDPGENKTPVSRYNLDTPFFDFQEKEAPYAKGGKQVRAIGFPGQDYFVVSDAVESGSAAPAEFALYLHGGRGGMTGTGNQRTWIYGPNVYGPAAKMAAWVFPANAAFANAKGEVTYIKGDYDEYPYVSATQNEAKAQFLQVIVPLSAQAALPEVTDLSSSKSVLGARVKKGEFTDTFLQQPGGASVTAGELNADATFAWVRTGAGGNLHQWMVRQATQVKWGKDSTLLTASVPVTMALDVHDPTAYSGSIAAMDGSYTLKLGAPAGRAVTEATLNGKAVPVATEKGFTVLQLTGGGALTVSFGEAQVTTTGLSPGLGGGIGLAAVVALAVGGAGLLIGLWFRRRRAAQVRV